MITIIYLRKDWTAYLRINDSVGIINTGRCVCDSSSARDNLMRPEVQYAVTLQPRAHLVHPWSAVSQSFTHKM